MTSFDCKYQNPAVFCFLMLIRTIVVYSLLFELVVRELVITSLFEEEPPCLGRGVIEDTTYLMNITDNILLALKFELTQIFS